MSTIHLFLSKVVLWIDGLLGLVLVLVFGYGEKYHRHGPIPKKGPLSGAQFMRLHKEKMKNAE